MLQCIVCLKYISGCHDLLVSDAWLSSVRSQSMTACCVKCCGYRCKTTDCLKTSWGLTAVSNSDNGKCSTAIECVNPVLHATVVALSTSRYVWQLLISRLITDGDGFSRWLHLTVRITRVWMDGCIRRWGEEIVWTPVQNIGWRMLMSMSNQSLLVMCIRACIWWRDASHVTRCNNCLFQSSMRPVLSH